MTADDIYLLLSGQKGQGDNYLNVGTKEEKLPLTLYNVLSYDEIKLSAFLTVSSYSELINDGNRFNKGIIEEDKEKIECEGVVVGVIGARFERPGVMEYQDIIIDSQQNTKSNGYGCHDTVDDTKDAKSLYRQLWNNFYEEPDHLFNDCQVNDERFGTASKIPDAIFDNVMMKKRYAISFDTLLLESDIRGKLANQPAYVHVVGIGLGIWKAAEQQTQIFLQGFHQRVQSLMPQLQHLNVVHFSWFNVSECGELKDNGLIKSSTHPNGGIKTFLSNRNPNEKLPKEFADHLLIICYAWDGNALPGNDFWVKELSGSNDSSTACSTLITELQNAHINEEYVCGRNLHIASTTYGVLHINDYLDCIEEKE